MPLRPKNANGPGKSRSRWREPINRYPVKVNLIIETAPLRIKLYRAKIAPARYPTPQLTPQVSEVLEKALALSTQDRGLIIDRLIESLDNEPAEEGVEAAWSEEIKRRVEEIRSGKVEMIPGEEVDRRLARLSNGKK
jgi:putative addiction module component (TIGR02574 family)